MRDFAILQDPEWQRRQLVAGGIAVAFAAVLAAVGAFASDRYDPFQRIGYWMLIFVFWAIVARTVVRLLPGQPEPGEQGRWKTLVLATIIASVPMLGIVMFTTAAVAPWTPNAGDMIEQLVGIWGLGGAYLYFVDRPSRSEPGPVLDPADIPKEEGGSARFEPEAQRQRLLEKLPGHRHDDIVCLAGEDHYVRVYTRHGNSLILMRFNDALEEVAELDGYRVHRSWWVSDDAVLAIFREGRTARLDLGAGLTVPVSQPYVAEAFSRWGGPDNRRQPTAA